MPQFDGTGPMGYGPATGRGMGPCTGYAGFYGYGRGRGYGRGFGRGLRRRVFTPYGYANYQAPTRDEEKQMLKDYIKDLEKELKDVKEELSKMDK